MTDDIRDDLAYVKALAEEGRDTPLVGGIHYVIWGSIIGTAAFLSYANTMSWFAFPFASAYPFWIVALSLGWIASFTFGRLTRRKPGAATLGNKTAMSVWFAVGIFMTGFWLTLMVVHDNFASLGVPPYFLFGMMFPIAFGLYGVAFYATATAGRARWLMFVAGASWIFSILALLTLGTAHQSLVGALGSLCCAVLPGVFLMRGEPSEVV